MSAVRTPLAVEVRRILLVEDSKIDQRFITRILQSLFPGVEVVVAASVSRARHALENGPYDVGMVDWQLPDGFGEEVLKAAMACDPPVPVVMMTGGDAADAERMLSEGAQDFVSKGRDRKEMPSYILRAVQYAVSRARADSKRQQQAMLSESEERNQALVRLAAGVAHDLNNTLAVVSMNLELLTSLVGPLSRDAAECLDSAREAAQAAAERCAQLRTYTGSVEVKSHPVDVADLVATTLREAGLSLEPIRDALGSDSATVRGDTEVLLTLFRRLVAGVAELGEPIAPVLSFGKPELLRGAQWVLPAGDGAPVELRVTLGWHGEPVDPQDLRRRFDPFGEGAHGASLDLGESVGLLRAHSGALAVHSTPDGGTFDVWLPPWSPGAARPRPPAPKRPEGATKVWVVDDEPLVLRVMVRLLQLRGMEVEAFPDGYDAYMAALDGRSCDVLVTDLLMTGMGGAELVDRLRAEGWTQPVVVVTGYSDQVSSLSSTDGVRVLLKPFTNAELFEAIDTLIEADR